MNSTFACTVVPPGESYQVNLLFVMQKSSEVTTHTWVKKTLSTFSHDS
jgi:hypothetical protein